MDKKCYKCQEWKPLLAFNKNKSKKDGLDTVCRDCRKAWKQANKEKINNYNRDRYVPRIRVLLSEDEKKCRKRKRESQYYKKHYIPSQRVLLTEEEKKVKRRDYKKNSKVNHDVLVRYRKRQSDELRDGYVKKSISKRTGCSLSEINNELIELERNRIRIVRKIKQFKN